MFKNSTKYIFPFHTSTHYFSYVQFFNDISQLTWALTNQIYFRELIVNPARSITCLTS